jgi:hypothetical protein
VSNTPTADQLLAVLRPVADTNHIARRMIRQVEDAADPEAEAQRVVRSVQRSIETITEIIRKIQGAFTDLAAALHPAVEAWVDDGIADAEHHANGPRRS